MIKRITSNILLFSVLMSLLFFPMVFIKASYAKPQDVLSMEDIKTEYLQDRVQKQDERILELEQIVTQLQKQLEVQQDEMQQSDLQITSTLEKNQPTTLEAVEPNQSKE